MMKMVIGGFLLSFWASTSSFNVNPALKMIGSYALLLGLFLVVDYYSNGKVMQVVFDGDKRTRQSKRSNKNIDNKI